MNDGIFYYKLITHRNKILEKRLKYFLVIHKELHYDTAPWRSKHLAKTLVLKFSTRSGEHLDTQETSDSDWV